MDLGIKKTKIVAAQSVPRWLCSSPRSHRIAAPTADKRKAPSYLHNVVEMLAAVVVGGGGACVAQESLASQCCVVRRAA
jgi:hypothetical protein